MITSFNTCQPNQQIPPKQGRNLTHKFPNSQIEEKNKSVAFTKKRHKKIVTKSGYISLKQKNKIQSISVHLPTQIKQAKYSIIFLTNLSNKTKYKKKKKQYLSNQVFQNSQIKKRHTDEISGNSISRVHTTQLNQLMQPHFIEHLMRHHRGERQESNGMAISFSLIA